MTVVTSPLLRDDSAAHVLQSGFLNQVPFDPLGMKNDDMREKEIKNGRLAMAAFVGFSSQAAVQGKGPIESLKYHLADPFHHNSESSFIYDSNSALTCVKCHSNLRQGPH